MIKGHILYIEDDCDNRELLTKFLTIEGYHVTCADTPKQALELASTLSFDLYIVDNWLPELNGPELTTKIREFDPKTPVLFYSGAGYESDKAKAHQAGAQGYLVKPVYPDDLLTEIARLIPKPESP